MRAAPLADERAELARIGSDGYRVSILLPSLAMIDFGLPPTEFHARCFEKEPRLFRGALAERPFGWGDLDGLLHSIEATAPTMRLFHQGVVPEPAFTEQIAGLGRARRRLNKIKFYGYMESGATLVINRLEDHSIAAQRLCTAVGRFAGAQPSGNAYLSFNGRGTFGKHWDTHDVFAIQLMGRKRWQIFAPTFPLPLTYQTNERTGHVCPEKPVLDFTLEEGDVVYIPRGWWHQAIPFDVGSFHLSVGTYTGTLFDYVMWTSSRYLEQHAATRRAFSVADYRDALSEAVRELPALLLDPKVAAEFERETIGRESSTAEFNLGLSLDSSPSPLAEAALVSLTTAHAPKLERGELRVNGTPVRVDPLGQAVIAALRDDSALRFDALCARLRDVQPDALQRAVLNLARYDIVSIRT